MPRTPLLLLLFAPLLGSCGSTPTSELTIHSAPQGAEVHLQRIGDRDYEGKLGPISGDVKSEDYASSFVFIGHTPLSYDVELEEKESGGTVLGIGGRVMLEYHEGILRLTKPGFEPFERRIPLQDGEQSFSFKLTPLEGQGQ